MSRTGVLAVVAIVLAPCVGRAADDVVRAGLTVRGGQATVEVTIAPGWHVNAHQPRDEFLIPTSVTLTPSNPKDAKYLSGSQVKDLTQYVKGLNS